jgi:thiamine-phosphate pyrophosphorylase
MPGSMTDPHLPALYAIVDEEVAARAGQPVPALARAYLAGGARFLQLRAKLASSRQFLAWADEIVADAQRVDPPAIVVINDRIDIALMAGASVTAGTSGVAAGVRAVHVGQDDLPVDAVRRLLGPEAIVGLSTHTPAQIEEALRLPISYLAVGPVFGTQTKATGYQAVGLDLVRHAVAMAGDIPVVAIGGITLERAASVIEAGARSVAVITDLVGPPAHGASGLGTPDPAARAAAFVRMLQTH